MSQPNLTANPQDIIEEANESETVEIAIPDLSASNDNLEEDTNGAAPGGLDALILEEGLVEEGETIEPNAIVFAADEWTPEAVAASATVPGDESSDLVVPLKAVEALTPSAASPTPDATEQKSLNATLDNTVSHLKTDQYPDLIVMREQSLENMFSKIAKAADVKDAYGFPVALVSDDTIELSSRQLLSSPKLDPTDLLFVNADYNMDTDQLDLSIGVPISRSGSIESLVFDPQTLLFDKTDEYREYPRPGTPTKTISKTTVIRDEESTLPNALGSGELKTVDELIQQEVVSAPETKIDREAVIQSILKNLEQKDKLTSKNIALQNKLADYFKKKRTDESRDTEKSMADQESRYQNIMNSLAELHDEAEAVKVTNRKITSDYQLKLEERLAEVNEKAESFWKYKRSVAVNAENSRTGKSLPEKVVEQLETMERKKENEVVTVRLENIKLRNKLRRQEQLLRQKEELADGLHLIDFEQLKIENQTYNEKIEERNEELLKLRKKITNVVQVLTHVKEKLQFIQAETVNLKNELKQLDEEVTIKRDSLPSLKNARDKLKSTNSLLRQQNGLLGNEKLLLDYGENVDEAKHLKEQIIELQNQHAKLVEESVMIRRRIQKTQLIAKLRGTNTTAGATMTT